MEQIKQEVLGRINELKKVNFVKPSVRELHSSKPLLSRGSRQLVKLYGNNIARQKVKLNSDLNKIQTYLDSVERQEENIVQPVITIRKRPRLMRTRLERGRRRGRY